MTRTMHNTIADLRTQVAALHSELTRNNLVVWTAGNVSARVPGEDLLVIKPSGFLDYLTRNNLQRLGARGAQLHRATD